MNPTRRIAFTLARAGFLSASDSRDVMRTTMVSALLLIGCAQNPVEVSIRGATDHSVTVRLGADVRITLQNVGPSGEYESPPSISSAALRFEDVAVVPPFVPAGSTQEFRFKAAAKGQAIVVFTHTGNNPTVTDTITVQ